jgi:hypothetical protein
MATRKPRSPRYPQLPLREAIERVGKVHRAERTHRVEKEAVAKDLGYGGLNGASISLIGTLKLYGLLHEDKEGVRVTEDAVILLRAPEGDPDRAEVLRRAAFAPKVFAELREAFGDDPSELPSEATQQYRLERQGFLERAASEVIRVYRDNLELVLEEAAEYTDADVEDQQEVEPPMAQPTAGQQIPPSGSYGGVVDAGASRDGGAPTTILRFKISEASEARIELTGDVTQGAIEMLAKILEAQKLVFPKESKPEQPAVEQPTERPAIEGPVPEQKPASPDDDTPF